MATQQIAMTGPLALQELHGRHAHPPGRRADRVLAPPRRDGGELRPAHAQPRAVVHRARRHRRDRGDARVCERAVRRRTPRGAGGVRRDGRELADWLKALRGFINATTNASTCDAATTSSIGAAHRHPPSGGMGLAQKHHQRLLHRAPREVIKIRSPHDHSAFELVGHQPV